jgi:hypothetical protein
MSKLTDAIRYYQTHDRGRAVPPLDLKYLTCTQSYSERFTQDYISYTFEAKFRSSVTISESAASTAIDNVLAQVRRQVAEEVFGEYRAALQSIQTLAYASNVVSIAHIARDIERSMFWD